MADRINAKECSLWDLMSGDYIFNIPDYQRPYSWTENEAVTLWDDLVDFWKNTEDNKQQTYFTGSIVLVKSLESPESEVIDGQQRLTTLSLILSILKNRSKDYGNDIKKCLWEEGISHKGIPDRPRLSLRKRDKEFFTKYVAKTGIDKLLGLNARNLSDDAQRLILSNAQLLAKKADEVFSSNEEVDSFVKTVFNQCFFVVVTTPDNESAFRVFSVLNNRGLSLLPSDILKAHVIGGIEANSRDYYTNKWEDIEVSLGREAFNSLLSHIRTIYGKSKLHGTLVAEFEKVVFPAYKSKSGIITDVIEPYAKAYREITTCTYSSSFGADSVNEYLYWLNKIDDSDWVPVMMYAIGQSSVTTQEMVKFAKDLERLASFFYITSKTSNQRIERYSRILDTMEKGSINDVYDVMNLSSFERAEFVEVLNGDIYLLPARKRSFVVLRLDRFISDKAAQYQNSIFSIEHVLPQTPKSGSQWLTDWPETGLREYWTHKIANLVPLTRKKNSQAQNYDFQEKKKKYISDKSGVTTYALATEILSEPSWTPDTVSKRQKRLIGVFSQNWELINNTTTENQPQDTIPVEAPAEILMQEQLFRKIDTFFAANPDTLLPKLPDKELKVGEYVHQAIHALSTSGFSLSEEQLNKLCEVESSKPYTRRNLAFLIPEEKEGLTAKLLKRYWVSSAYIESFNGKRYYVYSQWYGVQKESTDAHLSDFLRLYLDIAEGKF